MVGVEDGVNVAAVWITCGRFEVIVGLGRKHIHYSSLAYTTSVWGGQWIVIRVHLQYKTMQRCTKCRHFPMFTLFAGSTDSVDYRILKYKRSKQPFFYNFLKWVFSNRAVTWSISTREGSIALQRPLPITVAACSSPYLLWRSKLGSLYSYSHRTQSQYWRVL